jgi:adenylate cyclase
MTESSPTGDVSASDVFVSYASQDAAVANAIVETLEGQGIRCWIAPRDVTPGAHYADEIIGAISGAKALILVLSDSALASKHVSKEVERASSKGRPIIALRLGKAPLTPALEYFLSESQWIEAPDGHVAAALSKVVTAVQRLSHSAAGPTPAAAEISRWRPPADGPTKLSARRFKLSGPRIAVLALILAALAYFAVPKFWPWKRAIPATVSAVATPNVAISDKSIAVLPFVDMSEKHDQEYFSDGLSEELIDHLAHNPDLKVIARTSSFAFKGKNEDMRTIAKKLGVANLLEGSVRNAGGKLRITAQLIRASDGVHLWSEIYDRELRDIFKVQDDISTTVAKALNVALAARTTGASQPAATETRNIEAYNLMLQGNFHFGRENQGDLARAVEYFQQAIKLDPHYATPWAKLARTYALQGYSGALSAAQAELKGRDAAERALAIDPKCAEAYYARGNIFRFIVGDWSAARADYEKAVTLDPRGEVGDVAQANIFLLKGEMSGNTIDYLEWTHHRLERNPLDTSAFWDLAETQRDAGLLNEAAVTHLKLLDINPTFATAQAQYAVTLLLMGKRVEALAAADRESDDASKFQALACIYWAIGQRAQSDAALGALEHRFSDRNLYEIAAAHAYRGEVDAAFAWLDRAYDQKRGSLELLRVAALFRNLHGDPRWTPFLRKVKLIE